MKNLLFTFLFSFVLCIVFGLVFLPFLKRLKAGQPVLSYVKEHELKNGTPTLGGIFFVLSSIISSIVFSFESGSVFFLILAIGFSFMIVGFIDDFIKIKTCQNEGLKPYQKIIFQLFISFIASVFAYRNNYVYFNIPFSQKSVNLGRFSIIIDILIFISTTNCVNLTDGLDGLASSTSFFYFLGIFIVCFLQRNNGEVLSIDYIIFSLLGGLFGFLFFNTFKASVFMGDTGSLALGGFIASITIFTNNSFFLPILGIVFVASGLSVIIQVVSYKLTKKRVFKMAPLHHHLELIGLKESKIVYIYSAITVLMGGLLVIFYM